MRGRRRQVLARVAAPLAFLALALLGIVAVRSALDRTESAPPAAVGTTATATTRTTPRNPTTTAPEQNQGRRFYRVQEGDTLESIAAAHDTTVVRLQQLNPGIDPVALSIGQRIRVG